MHRNKNKSIHMTKLKRICLFKFRVIFSLGLEKEEKVPFRYIQETLLKIYNVFSPYTRFNKSEGNFALEKKLVTP